MSVRTSARGVEVGDAGHLLDALAPRGPGSGDDHLAHEQMVSTRRLLEREWARPSRPRAFCGCSVLENGGDDRLPVVAMNTVTRTLQRQQPGAGDLSAQNLAVLAREHRVGDAVDDERRGSDRTQRLRRSFAVR